MWYKNIASSFFGLVTKYTRQMDRQTDGQNYDSQDHASKGKVRFLSHRLGDLEVTYALHL